MRRLALVSAFVAFGVLAGCATVAPPAAPRAPAAASAAPAVDWAQDPFLDTLQQRTFAWFWDTTNPANGLVPDRWPTPSFSSVASVGFGITGYGVGVERGYVTRAEAAERTLTTLRFLWDAPQGPQQTGRAGYKGFYYHFLDMETGERFRGVELSSIDTALLMAGVLFAREFYDGPDAAEAQIRAYSDSLYQRVEWDWMRPNSARIGMGWHPETGFLPYDYQGYTEAMLLYVLALGSPTFPVAADAWPAFTATSTWSTFQGQPHAGFPPLFGHQYSHAWIDFRGIQDDWIRGYGIDYFENSRRATYSQQAYAVENPGGWAGYGDDIWGLTASDGPADVQRAFGGTMRQFHTYTARGAGTENVQDDGTIVPTAAGGSLAFAPEIALPALKAMRARYGPAVWGEYGFLDAFNPSFTFADVRLQHGRLVPGYGWADTDYLGIDQGPILLMAENLRSELVWRTIRRSPYVVAGLRRAGFTGGWLDAATAAMPATVAGPRQPEPGARPEGSRLVVVLGSSTAEGTGPLANDSTWVNRLRARLLAADARADVLNLARGGYTTFNVLPTGATARPAPLQVDTVRNVTAALRRRPDAVVVNLPSNDLAAGATVAEQMANYERIAAAAEAVGVPLYVTTPMPRDALGAAGVASQLALRDALLARFGSRAVDLWPLVTTAQGRLDARFDSGDGLHLNDAAHRHIARAVFESGLADFLRRP